MGASRLVFCLAFLLLLLLASVQGRATESAAGYQPYQAGDRFEYNLYWSRIKVGEAELSFDRDTLPGNPEREVLRMTFIVRTSGIANRIYRVDNRLQTWLDPKTWQPLHHTKRQREGRRERDIVLYFDACAGTVVYENAGVKNDPVAIPAGTQDPLSLLGDIARKPFYAGALFEVPATDGREATVMRAEVVEEALQRTPLGLFKSIKFDVATDELRGVFSKSPDAVIEVWFSADAYRLPLRMRSEVSVGSFYGELTGYRSEWIDSVDELPAWSREMPSSRVRRGGR